jgi:hypothetical protein
VAPLSPDDVKRWDADAIHGVFQVATNRATTLQTLGDNLQQVHGTLSDWHGEAGDAFRADPAKRVATSKQTAMSPSRSPRRYRARKRTYARSKPNSIESSKQPPATASPSRRTGELTPAG